MGFVIGVRSDGTILTAGKGKCAMTELTCMPGIKDIFIYDNEEYDYYNYAFGINPDGTLRAYNQQWMHWFGDERMNNYEKLRDVIQVACAPSGYIALFADGTTRVGIQNTTIYYNDIGRVPTGAAEFIELDGLENIISVVAGGTLDSAFALALGADGAVLPAGNIDVDWKSVKQLTAGHNGAACVHKDGTVSVSASLADAYKECASWTDISAVSLGHDHIVGLKSDGTCVAAGDDSFGQCGLGEFKNVKQIAAGARHTLLLFEDGTCAAVGDDTAFNNALIHVKNFTGALNVSGWENVTSVRACDGLSIGFTEDGEMLFAGLGTTDVSGIENVRLWTGERARADAPLNVPNKITERKNAAIAAARADYEAVMEFCALRSEAARVAKQKHPEYDDVWSEAYGLMLYRQNGYYGFLNMEGEVVLPAEYIEIDRQPLGGMYVLYNRNGYGFADMTGKVRVPCQYGATNGFNADGYAEVGSGEYGAPRMWIDRDGNTVPAPAKTSEQPAPEARYTATNNENDHTYERHGYKDALTGETVYPDFFDRAQDFEGELAQIAIKEIYAYITQDFMLASPLDIKLP